MSALYFAAIPDPGEGDLLAFRDAAVTFAACRRDKGRFLWQTSPAGEALLGWLGLEGRAGEPAGVCYLDASRSALAGIEVRRLADGAPLRGYSLNDLRCEGMVAEAVFAALIRSSYGPEGVDYFPTSSELSFYFEDGLLLQGQARWDTEYLQACQSFFMEELTPAELVTKALTSLPWEVGARLEPLAQRFAEELHGVAFLVASELENLKPLAELLQALLTKKDCPQGLDELLARVGSKPRRESWESAWSALAESLRDELAETPCPGFTEQASSLLFTAGPELLAWRAGRTQEAVS